MHGASLPFWVRKCFRLVERFRTRETTSTACGEDVDVLIASTVCGGTSLTATFFHESH